jgi:hypothetical protein
MRYLPFILLAGLLASAPARLYAHGVAVILTADGDKKIHTDKQVYSNGLFELLGGKVLTAEEPGYSIANSKQGFSAFSSIRLNVIDQLLWWKDGVVRLDTAERLKVVNPDGILTTIDKDTVYVGGYEIEHYDGLAGWHEHLDYTMQSPSAPTGAYGLLVQITAPGYQKSDNILLVFNHGLTAGVYNAAVQALTLAEFKTPGDANGDGFVDGADYTLWADHYLQAATWRYGNFNYDAIVDGADYTVWADNFSPAISATAHAVPEPATLWLIIVGAAIAAAGFGQANRMGRMPAGDPCTSGRQFP